MGRTSVPLLDARRAIRLAHANSGAWHIDPKRLGIIGFSAGGYLAAIAATKFDSGATEQDANGDPLERFSSRPDFAILIDPVITMGEGTHAGSREILLVPNASPEGIDVFSADSSWCSPPGAASPPGTGGYSRNGSGSPAASPR